MSIPAPVVPKGALPAGVPSPAELETLLRRHVIDPWFPRCLDLERGGFLCDFDRAWHACGPHDKLLEFQARQTNFAAEAARRYPADARLSQAARHGFDYLRDVMWDAAHGGWFHRLDRAGVPLEVQTKHAHGIAYAIQACTAVHQLSGDPDALALARLGFDWLDAHAHDREHGGYFGFLARDGAVITRAGDACWHEQVDTIGIPLGCKDLNVHCDLLEALIALYQAGRDATVGERLHELVDIVCDRMVTRSAGIHYYFEPDWMPVPHVTHFGAELQTVHRLFVAGELLDDSARLMPVAFRLVEHALKHGWDHRAGGFYYAGPGICVPGIQDYDLVVRRKAWWVQWEALRALRAATLARKEGDEYLAWLRAQWVYLCRNLFDEQYAGVFRTGLDDASTSPVPDSGAGLHKGADWKDASHEGRALLYCIAAPPRA